MQTYVVLTDNCGAAVLIEAYGQDASLSNRFGRSACMDWAALGAALAASLACGGWLGASPK